MGGRGRGSRGRGGGARRGGVWGRARARGAGARAGCGQSGSRTLPSGGGGEPEPPARPHPGTGQPRPAPPYPPPLEPLPAGEGTLPAGVGCDVFCACAAGAAEGKACERGWLEVRWGRRTARSPARPPALGDRRCGGRSVPTASALPPSRLAWRRFPGGSAGPGPAPGRGWLVSPILCH